MFLLPQSYWSVKTTAHKGRGAFAARDMEAGVVIGDYIGEIIHTEDDTDVDGIYGMSWSDKYCIEPKRKSIGVHCINHSCMPNCGMYPYRGHMLFIALRKIFAGEEFHVSYMIEPGGEIHGDYHCLCHTPLRTGSMMVSQKKSKAFWDTFVRVKQGKYRDIPVAPYDAVITLLSKIPPRVEDNEIYDIFGSLEHAPEDSDASMVPTIKDIRSFIREHGVGMRLKKLRVTIIGVKDTYCIVAPE